MTSYLRRILKLGSPLGNVLLSTVGCFVLMHGSGFDANCKDGSDTLPPFREDGRSRRSLAGGGAALFLLACIASEALVMIRAICR
jgi:hypothetical protein